MGKQGFRCKLGLDLTVRSLEYHDLGLAGSDCLLFTGLLSGAQNFNQSKNEQISLFSIYVPTTYTHVKYIYIYTLPYNFLREKAVPVYTQVKISEGRGLCGFHCLENGCGGGHGQTKCLFVRIQNIARPFRD